MVVICLRGAFSRFLDLLDSVPDLLDGCSGRGDSAQGLGLADLVVVGLVEFGNLGVGYKSFVFKADLATALMAVPENQQHN